MTRPFLVHDMSYKFLCVECWSCSTSRVACSCAQPLVHAIVQSCSTCSVRRETFKCLINRIPKKSSVRSALCRRPITFRGTMKNKYNVVCHVTYIPHQFEHVRLISYQPYHHSWVHSLCIHCCRFKSKLYAVSESAAVWAFRFLCLSCNFLSNGVMARAFDCLNSLSIDSKNSFWFTISFDSSFMYSIKSL